MALPAPKLTSRRARIAIPLGIAFLALLVASTALLPFAEPRAITAQPPSTYSPVAVTGMTTPITVDREPDSEIVVDFSIPMETADVGVDLETDEILAFLVRGPATAPAVRSSTGIAAGGSGADPSDRTLARMVVATATTTTDTAARDSAATAPEEKARMVKLAAEKKAAAAAKAAADKAKKAKAAAAKAAAEKRKAAAAAEKKKRAKAAAEKKAAKEAADAAKAKAKAQPSNSAGGGTLASVEAYYLGLVNCARTGGVISKSGKCSGGGSRNVRPLRLDAGISSKVSRPYARKLATSGACSHFSGNSPSSRLRGAGYSSPRWAENLSCPRGMSASSAAVYSIRYFQNEKAWNGGHWRNLRNPQYDRVGIGIWAANGRVIVVTNFYRG